MLGQALPAHLVPVGGCGARAVSCKTPIYFMYYIYVVEMWERFASKILGPRKIALGGKKSIKKKITEFALFTLSCLCFLGMYISFTVKVTVYPARALRALGLLLADSAPTVGRGKTF